MKRVSTLTPKLTRFRRLQPEHAHTAASAVGKPKITMQFACIDYPNSLINQLCLVKKNHPYISRIILLTLCKRNKSGRAWHISQLKQIKACMLYNIHNACCHLRENSGKILLKKNNRANLPALYNRKQKQKRNSNS